VPTLVVDVEHLDRVVGKFGVCPSAAEFPVWAANDVDELLRAEARLGMQGNEAALSKRLNNFNKYKIIRIFKLWLLAD
jgi:hypothetical protein